MRGGITESIDSFESKELSEPAEKLENVKTVDRSNSGKDAH
jgi:hypothetical protein